MSQSKTPCELKSMMIKKKNNLSARANRRKSIWKNDSVRKKDKKKEDRYT